MGLKTDLKKTSAYLKKNGLPDTVNAVRERFYVRRQKYSYDEPSEDILEKQRNTEFKNPLKISIVVPAYETDELFLEDMILSVMEQTYPAYELIIADASVSDKVEKKTKELCAEYDNIVYLKLEKNAGISENTNAALEAAGGDYTGLLDHDDMLTKDALFSVMEAIDKLSVNPLMVYTDEDKCDGTSYRYFEPNIKKDIDPDMLFTNNYICHFSVYRTDVIKSLGLRGEYDGAQDYDLALRTLFMALESEGKLEELMIHVPKVCYHWRCHTGSTAEDPSSKDYAYEAGRRVAAQSLNRYLKMLNPSADEIEVYHSKHLGFYKADYGDRLFELRPDVKAVCGPVFKGGKLVLGGRDKNGNVLYKGLREGFAGPCNVASLLQRVYAGDEKNMKHNPSGRGDVILYDPDMTVEL